MSDRDAGGCLLVVLVVLALWGVVELAQWLGEGFNMTLFGALLALLLLAWLWSIPGARVVQPDAVGGGAVIAGTASAAKPLGLLLALAALYAGLAGFTFFLGLGYGLLGLLLGGFGFSMIGWSWWRPFRLRIGPRFHLPWWVHLATSAAIATIATGALLGYVAAATAHKADRRDRALAAYLAQGEDSMRSYDYDAASESLRRAKALSPDSRAVRRSQADLERRERLERDYRRAQRLGADGRYTAAIGELESLGSYRKAKEIRRTYRGEGVRVFLRRASRSVDKRPSKALSSLREAARIDRGVTQTSKYERLRARAKRVAAAERARERERERERERRYSSEIPSDEGLGREDGDGSYGGFGGGSDDDSGGRDRFDIPLVPFD